METHGKHGVSGALQRANAGLASLRLDRYFEPGGMLPPPPPTVSCGDLEVDRAERRAVLAGIDLHLTERECALLLCLADHANRVVRRSDLLAEVWTLPDDDESNLVAVYIRRLRQKLGTHAGMIKTIRGIGYRLRPALEG
jgi:DNA-binding response OmpR family regulator